MQHNRDERQAESGECSFTAVRSRRKYNENQLTMRKEEEGEPNGTIC